MNPTTVKSNISSQGVEDEWIGCDLDGTLAEHYWPHKGAYHPFRIGDPIPAMLERVRAWVGAGQRVKIFTARVDGGLASRNDPDVPLEIQRIHFEEVDLIEDHIRVWCLKWIGFELEVTCKKDFKMIELWDDRAVRIVHNTGEPCCRAIA